jgi:RNA recognition motif-containing protein
MRLGFAPSGVAAAYLTTSGSGETHERELASDGLSFGACLMRKTIQIGNLDYSIDDHELARLFAPHGAVCSAKVSTHFSTGHSTGVGFVEMETDQAGESAITALNGRTHRGRILAVCWSKARHDRPDAIDHKPQRRAAVRAWVQDSRTAAE